MDIYSTSCERRHCSDDEFHRAGQERALEEVAALYELIHKMPDGPQKAHFLKRVSGSGQTQTAMYQNCCHVMLFRSKRAVKFLELLRLLSEVRNSR